MNSVKIGTVVSIGILALTIIVGSGSTALADPPMWWFCSLEGNPNYCEQDCIDEYHSFFVSFEHDWRACMDACNEEGGPGQGDCNQECDDTWADNVEALEQYVCDCIEFCID